MLYNLWYSIDKKANKTPSTKDRKMKLPEFVKKAADSGRRITTSIEDPNRKGCEWKVYNMEYSSLTGLCYITDNKGHKWYGTKESGYLTKAEWNSWK
jgi:hypothetical protein